MTLTHDNQLQEYCDSCAEDIIADADNENEAYDMSYEYADGSQYVIYYSEAHLLCQNCNTENGEAFFEECYSESKDLTYDKMATIIAYGEIQARISQKLYEHYEGYYND